MPCLSSRAGFARPLRCFCMSSRLITLISVTWQVSGMCVWFQCKQSPNSHVWQSLDSKVCFKEKNEEEEEEGERRRPSFRKNGKPVKPRCVYSIGFKWNNARTSSSAKSTLIAPSKGPGETTISLILLGPGNCPAPQCIAYRVGLLFTLLALRHWNSNRWVRASGQTEPFFWGPGLPMGALT